MKIYSMTATFGKLEHQTLTLQPGLNIIEAPNEWGKSTWCAFLVNMLYGIDTRARSTTAALADKERYAPWSGAPMAGRMELNWNGRDITIERSTKGRVIFGNFRAYETATGIDVPELNGTNCGQMLLGVERGVFTRAGFLRHSDLPVTQDDALRRRLNNLVTTGDESGAGDKLKETLKELKNKCRYNRSGLLPQAEAERDQLQNQLSDLHNLQNQAETIRTQQAQLSIAIARLENHAAALRYQESRQQLDTVAEADTAVAAAKERLALTIAACESLPPRDQAQQLLSRAQQLQEELQSLEMEERMLPPLPEQPEIPVHYRDMDPIAVAQADLQQNAALERSKKANGPILAVFLVLAAGALAAGIALPSWLIPLGAAAAALAVLGFVICGIRGSKIRKALDALYQRHPGIRPDHWVVDATQFVQRMEHYEALRRNAMELRGDLDQRAAALRTQITALTGGAELAQCQSQWAQTITAWDALSDARRDLQNQEITANKLRSMLQPVEPPKQPDDLTYNREETERLLARSRQHQQMLNIQLGQCQGQTENLGSETQIRARLDTLNRRIQRLEDTYYALEMAQDALRDATTQLQRRFAPRISSRAQELFQKLTGGRYQRITLGEDLSLSASAQDEDTLRSSQWRSDGTVDQLYLALRLAVAEELTPEAPLILDDALVQFDDARLKAAMQILKDAAQHKQVILFTCQSREKALESQL